MVFLFAYVLFPTLAAAAVSKPTSSCVPLPSPATTQQAGVFAKTVFDYLIIGGGTAGLTVASRLSESGQFQVGVLEAGVFHQNDPLVDEPGLSGRANGNPAYDWAFSTIPQSGANGRNIPTPRGKMLGGSSGLNLMAWNRGSQLEYDAWETFAPNAGWNWKGLQPYFAKSQMVAQNQTNPFPGVDPIDVVASFTHGSATGPIHTSYNVFYSDIVPNYVRTFNELGIKTNGDADDGDASGIYNTRGSIDRITGARSYAASGYYCQGSSRSNLKVLVGAEVTKISLSEFGTSYVATRVTFLAAGRKFSAAARKEIVISTSTIKTPQLLELSGDSKLLTRLGIQSLIDLPGVGENLQEHLFSPVQFQLTPGHHTFDELRNNVTFAAEQQALYDATHTGLFAAIDAALAFLPSRDFAGAQGTSSLLAAFDQVAQQTGLTTLQKQQYALQRDFLTKSIPQIEIICLTRGIIAPQQNQSYITILAGIQHPLSRGSVHINSVSPTVPPTINGSYMDNDFDLQTLLQALKFTIGLKDHQPLASNIAALNSPVTSNDNDLIMYIRNTFSPGSHIVGTAAMAPRSMGGVVDPSLVVYGTKNLRVVDASVVPLLVAAHTQSTIYAIAEKAAAMMLHKA